MTDQFVGEIRMFAGDFAPAGWAFCDGQLMAVSGNDMLFSLLGTTYGGDGRTTFALPDLRGRSPIHAGDGSGLTPRMIGASGGSEQVVVTAAAMPGHSHEPFNASQATGNEANPGGNLIAESPQIAMYIEDPPGVALNGASVADAGSSQPHNNLMPFQCVNFIIALTGLYPSRH